MCRHQCWEKVPRSHTWIKVKILYENVTLAKVKVTLTNNACPLTSLSEIKCSYLRIESTTKRKLYIFVHVCIKFLLGVDELLAKTSLGER